MSKNHSFMKAGKTLANLSKSTCSQLFLEITKGFKNPWRILFKKNSWTLIRIEDFVVFYLSLLTSSSPQLSDSLENQ